MNFELELKKVIIETLNLEDITPEDIDSYKPLFSDGLGLDSIDALELGIALKKKYNIILNSDDPNIKKHFESVHNLAKFIVAHRDN